MPNKSDKSLTHRKLLFMSRLLNPHVGGVERHVEELSKVLINRGYQITVITQQHDPKLPLIQKTDLYTVYRVPYYLRSKFQIWLWIMLHLNLFLMANVVHAHDVFWWALPVRFLLFWKAFYTTFHGYEGAQQPTDNAIRSRRVSEQLSRGNICVGAWMQKWYGTAPTKVLYGAADFQPKPLVKTQGAVFIGRLSEDTGVLAYIQGIQLMQGKIELDIYGEGDLLDQVLADIAPTPYIRYKGIGKDVAYLLRTHRFAFVSRYLGMIEAMQVGRYVFAQWNNSIKRDYLKSFPSAHFASLFNLPEELSQELSYIITHPAEEMKNIEEAQQWAVKQTWENVADIYEELWKK